MARESDGGGGRALGYTDVLDILEIVDGAGEECEVVVDAGDFHLRFVKEAAGGGPAPAGTFGAEASPTDAPTRRTLP